MKPLIIVLAFALLPSCLAAQRIKLKVEPASAQDTMFTAMHQLVWKQTWERSEAAEYLLGMGFEEAGCEGDMWFWSSTHLPCKRLFDFKSAFERSRDDFGVRLSVLFWNLDFRGVVLSEKERGTKATLLALILPTKYLATIVHALGKHLVRWDKPVATSMEDEYGLEGKKIELAFQGGTVHPYRTVTVRVVEDMVVVLLGEIFDQSYGPTLYRLPKYTHPAPDSSVQSDDSVRCFKVAPMIKMNPHRDRGK